MTRPSEVKSSSKARDGRRWLLAVLLAGAPFVAVHADGPMGVMGPPAGTPMGMPASAASADLSDPDAADTTSSEPARFAAFPGTPRIYHLGATGFFLDHPEHITLTAGQRKSLESVKADAQGRQARYRTRIEGAENELWSLTGAESPDADAIDSKVREIESLRSDERIAYIHAIAEAAEVLTEQQRKQLAGGVPPKSDTGSEPPKAAAPKKGK